MRIDTAPVVAALEAVRVFDGAQPRLLDAEALLEAQAAAGRLRRAAEAVLAGLAFEVGRRSAPDAGAGGLARSRGFNTPARLIAEDSGGSVSDAIRLMEAGAALGRDPDVAEAAGSPAGTDVAGTDVAGTDVAGTDVAGPNADASEDEQSPLAKALAAGDIGAEKAAVVRSTLEALTQPAAASGGDAGDEPDPESEASNDQAREAKQKEIELKLVAKAKELSLADLRRLCNRSRAQHDPAAWAEREQRQYDSRSVTIADDQDGMVVLTARLDPPSAAPVKAWLDAQVKDAFSRRRDQDPTVLDTRSAGQIRADALVDLARHGLQCEEPGSGVSTTVAIRVPIDGLREETGLADCDDLSMPLSASAVRRMAVDAQVLPIILGGADEVLNLGRTRRLFSPGQRIALVERDGGCVMCHAPPSYCQAHHIEWWDKHKGATDLSNGVLLCSSCHHRVHRDGWTITATTTEVWITPPRSVDPAQVPRRGGRARIELAA